MRITTSILVVVMAGMLVGCGPSAEERYRTAQQILEYEELTLQKERELMAGIEANVRELLRYNGIAEARGFYTEKMRAETAEMILKQEKSRKDHAEWTAEQEKRIQHARERLREAEARLR